MIENESTPQKLKKDEESDGQRAVYFLLLSRTVEEREELSQ